MRMSSYIMKVLFSFLSGLAHCALAHTPHNKGCPEMGVD